jgi:hypothetical protein
MASSTESTVLCWPRAMIVTKMASYRDTTKMASYTRIITNQENLDSRTMDNGPSDEGSHTEDNTLHYQNASNYSVMMKSNKECSTKLT